MDECEARIAEATRRQARLVKLLAELQELRAQEVHREAELLQVARVYREGGYKPVEAVWKVLGYNSRGTAVHRVEQARAAGFLPPTTRGRVS